MAKFSALLVTWEPFIRMGTLSGICQYMGEAGVMESRLSNPITSLEEEYARPARLRPLVFVFISIHLACALQMDHLAIQPLKGRSSVKRLK